jgi:putative oxidoreductase
MAPFVGVIEIVCGTLIILGLLTRLAAIALIIDMLVAILSTKISILLGHGFWRFSLSKLTSYGLSSRLAQKRIVFKIDVLPLFKTLSS